VRAVVKPVPIGRGWSRTVKRTHHVSVLHVQDNHGRGIAKRSELQSTSSVIYRQTLIRYRTPAIPSWFRKDIIQIE
jgi:hypothetical protein